MRTLEQFQQIQESMYNGNWTYASEEVVKYGFWANDLITALKEQNEEYGFDENKGMDDIALVVEMAADLRNK